MAGKDINPLKVQKWKDTVKLNLSDIEYQPNPVQLGVAIAAAIEFSKKKK